MPHFFFRPPHFFFRPPHFFFRPQQVALPRYGKQQLRFFIRLCSGILLWFGGSFWGLAEETESPSLDITLELQKTFAKVQDSSEFSPKFDAEIRHNLKTHQQRGQEMAAESVARRLAAHPAASSELQLLAFEIQIRAAARRQNWLEVATLLPTRVTAADEIRWLATLQMVCYQAILSGEPEAAEALLERSQRIPALPSFAEELRARQARLGLRGRSMKELKPAKSKKQTEPGWAAVSFWSTTCRPCLEELPQLIQFEQTLTNGGDALYGIALEADPSVLEGFLGKRPLNWPNRLATAEVLRAARISTIPCLFLVDPKGRIAATDVPLEELLHGWTWQKPLLQTEADRR